VNMTEVTTNDSSDGHVTISITLYTKGIGQLSRIFSKLEGVRGVMSVSRNTSEMPRSS